MRLILMSLYPLLKNIYYYNRRRIRKLSCYPLRLLPTICYRREIDIDRVSNDLSCSVVRRAEGSYNDTFNEFDNARQNFISVDRIPELSMNLLGGKFETEDIRFRTRHDGSSNWEGEAVLLSEYNDSYEILDDNYPPIYFGLSRIHNRTVPYQMDVSGNKEARKFAQAFGKLTENNKSDLIATAVVKHAPTKMNYWHVILDIKTTNTSEGERSVRTAKSTWQKEVCSSVLGQILVVEASPTLALNSTIARQYYHRLFA